MYVPSLVTWWRLRSLVLLSTLSTSLSLSFSPPALPQPDFLLYRRRIKPRVLSTSAFVPLFLPSFLLVLSSASLPFFFFCARSNAIHRRRAREASLPFFSISTRLIARSRTTGIELLAVGDPLARLVPFFFFICETRSPPSPPPCLVAPARTEGSALSPSSVINSVNDQIYGGQRRWQRNENQRLNCRAVFPHDMGCMLDERFIGSHCYTCFLTSLSPRFFCSTLCSIRFVIYDCALF